LNGTDKYTIFDLPIEVTNEISAANDRPSCDALNNPLLSAETLNASANSFTRIAGSGIETKGGGTGGLGEGNILDWRSGSHWLWIGSLLLMIAL